MEKLLTNNDNICILLRISSNYFVAGIEIKNNKIISIAPIIKYMINWSMPEIKKYCKQKNWKIETINVKTSEHK